MAQLSRQIKFKRDNKAVYDADAFKRKIEAAREPIGLARTLGTAASLIIGCLGIYAAMHYLLAFVSTPQILGISQHNLAAAAIETKTASPLKSHLMRPFELKRSYVRVGQPIKAFYIIPEGAQVDLMIEKCRQSIIIEVFKCDVIGKTEVTVNSTEGTHQFKFKEAGFYKFDAQLRYNDGRDITQENSSSYYVLWKRGRP